MTRLLTKKEVGERLGLHPESVMRLAREGRLPAPIKFGSANNAAVRFDAGALDSFLEERRRSWLEEQRPQG